MVMNSTAVMPKNGAFGTVCPAGSRHSEILYIVILVIIIVIVILIVSLIIIIIISLIIIIILIIIIVVVIVVLIGVGSILSIAKKSSGVLSRWVTEQVACVAWNRLRISINYSFQKIRNRH